MAQRAIAVVALVVFSAVLFDLLNTDGYVARWYTTISGYSWPFDGRCILLPCHSH
ncbi:arylsulfate sulfotransferase [Ralstonia solanacearum]|nr:arylsulfate sulfotransferase [Ralstonia solanacearum]